jgi:hypothetical protein
MFTEYSRSNRQVWRAYVLAPIPTTIVFFLIALIGGPPEDWPTAAGVALIVAVIAYVSGALLLPFYWLFERVNWEGWRYYVPTAAFAGLVVARGMDAPLESSPWTYYAMAVACGAGCSVVFYLALQIDA